MWSEEFLSTALQDRPLGQGEPTSSLLGVQPDRHNVAASRGFVLGMKPEPKKPGTVVCAYNPRAEEVEEGEILAHRPAILNT